jgi:hypothetical protein
MRKRRISKDVVILLTSTVVTLASWIGFEVYRAYIQITIEPQVEKHLQQIDPSLNTELFSKLELLQP